MDDVFGFTWLVRGKLDLDCRIRFGMYYMQEVWLIELRICVSKYKYDWTYKLDLDKFIKDDRHEYEFEYEIIYETSMVNKRL